MTKLKPGFDFDESGDFSQIADYGYRDAYDQREPDPWSADERDYQVGYSDGEHDRRINEDEEA
jgi:hypothetical protein